MTARSASLSELACAGSLVALRGAVDLAAAALPGAEMTAADSRYERLSWEVTRRLHGDLLEVYRLSDAMQRDGADLLLPTSPWDAAGWSRTAAGSASAALRTARFLPLAPGWQDAWTELGNKLDVYRLVKQSAERIGTPAPGEPFDLRELVARCYRLDDYAALWALEGLGHDYVRRSWRADGSPPTGLLSDAVVEALPAGSLSMLHAGIGLGFADRLLGRLPPDASPAQRVEIVAEVLALCRASSQAGYVGAAFESLGLVTRTYHRQFVGAVDEALARLGESEARDDYWHGVGRALYFLPVNFLPIGDTTWRPFEMGLEVAPDAAARTQVLAGLGWAFTLVNMRQPELMSRLLLIPHGDALEAEDGFANGIASSILVRQDTTPLSSLVADFLGQPPPAAAAAPWERLVVEPSRRALVDVYPRLRRSREIGALFRARPGIGGSDVR